MRIVLMRGIPKSGKSTYVEKTFASSTCIICSADFYFMRDGSYNFDPNALNESQAGCLREFSHLIVDHAWGRLERLPEVLVVDNTNTSALELAPYVALASAYGYKCDIITVRCDPMVAHQRNIHGVPLTVIQRMADNIKVPLPPYWNINLINV